MQIQLSIKMFKSFSLKSLIFYKRFCSNKRLTDTIFALSSGLNSAISILRVSGPNARLALKLINQEKAQKITQRPRYMQFTRIYNQKRQIIDEGMVVYFPPNMSYNKQEMLQLHLHGSKAVVDAVFKQLRLMDMRMAQRGEITKRAVINGKISLNQAEAINDLISSETQFTRQISINNLLGKNMNYLDQLKEELVKSLAKSQAYIDFNEDQVNNFTQIVKSDVKQTLFDDTKLWVQKQVIPKIGNLLKNYKNLKILKDGVNVVIAGRPNVGKSTLINLMANKNVSIVNSKAGTTRDAIQTSVELEGFRLNLIDTAGLRKSQCEIQNEGVKKAKQKIDQSHIKLLLIDISQQESDYNQSTRSLSILIGDQDPEICSLFLDDSSILILNKIDLLQKDFQPKQITIKLRNHNNSTRKPTIMMSAGIQRKTQDLLKNLSQKLKIDFSHFLNPNQIFFTRERYFNHLQICLQKLELYVDQEQIDFACQYLRQAIKEVQQIFGRVDCQDVLDVLFRDFCIGK